MTVVLSFVKQQAASALQKKMALFINLLGKGIIQEINGERGPSDGLLVQHSNGRKSVVLDMKAHGDII